MLSRKQFDILDCLINEEKALSQRELAEQTNYSLGSINKALKELNELGAPDASDAPFLYKSIKFYA